MLRALLALVVLSAAFSVGQRASVYPPPVKSNEIPSLLEATKHARLMEESALLTLVPAQSGIFFVDCPNCESGRQEGQLTWDPARPEEVLCRYCSHVYPSRKYPDEKAVIVQNPRGEEQRYPYWENASGYRHFFQARRDDLKRAFLARSANDLARLYAATGEKQYARRAALLLNRFAEVFPGWCFHYDYPFQQKVIYSGEVKAEQFRPGYRTARWTWWAYSDIPLPLVEAYDWIVPSGIFAELAREKGIDVAARIEKDLFRHAADQVLANPESYTNMSPRAWRSLIVTGRVIGERRYVEEPTQRLRQFLSSKFLSDGVWPEGSPDYFAQTLGGLQSVMRALDGWKLHDGSALDFPILARAETALDMMRFPDGRRLPIHDSWPTSRREPLAGTKPYLLPALGHACLGGGADADQQQFHLSWSGGYGHQHADILNLMVYSHGREMLSDIGYTHTRYRPWTISTAAHNTVILDGKSQEFGGREKPSDGSLRWYDASHPRVQTVSADGIRAYPDAKRYRRTLVVIDPADAPRYAVDLFDVDGGSQRDYFLHGSADTPTELDVGLESAPVPSLLPSGTEWKPPANEGEVARARLPYDAYGFLRNIRSTPVKSPKSLAMTFRPPTDKEPALHVTLLPPAGSTLFTGVAPAVRGAAEDDEKLDHFMRSFIALRHRGGSQSAFIAVLEPYSGSPSIASVERLPARYASLVLKVRRKDRTDLIFVDAERPVPISVDGRSLAFRGKAGVLTLRGETPETLYLLGATLAGLPGGPVSSPKARAKLRSTDGDTLLLGSAIEPLPHRGDVVRLATADGWIYPFHVKAAEQAADGPRITVNEGPVPSYDPIGKKLALAAFPTREHVGQCFVDWDRAGIWNLSSAPAVDSSVIRTIPRRTR